MRTPGHRKERTPHTPREPETATTTPEGLVTSWWENHTTPTHPQHSPNPHPAVIIHWWDAISYGTDNWTDPDDPHPRPEPSLAIGWITHQDTEAITITPLTNTNQWGHGITIPHGCIHAITHLPTPTHPPQTHTPPNTKRRKP